MYNILQLQRYQVNFREEFFQDEAVSLDHGPHNYVTLLTGFHLLVAEGCDPEDGNIVIT